MFSAFAAGVFMVVTGVIGMNVGRSGARWVDGPIWWQVALGIAFLLLGAYWSRRLDDPRWLLIYGPRRYQIKYVGRGKAYSDTPSEGGQHVTRRSLRGTSDSPDTGAERAD